MLSADYPNKKYCCNAHRQMAFQLRKKGLTGKPEAQIELPPTRRTFPKTEYRPFKDAHFTSEIEEIEMLVTKSGKKLDVYKHSDGRYHFYKEIKV